MSSDGIKRLDSVRSFYRENTRNDVPGIERELNAIKNEIMFLNEQVSYQSTPVTSKTNSPYLPDQGFYFKDTVYNSTEETDWKKELPTYESTYNTAANLNFKKLNIL